MEALLSLSFDNISSKDGVKIRKGLRQIEGLLAQICLSQHSTSSSPSKRGMSVVPTAQPPSSPKELDALAGDPAFREFFRLQEGFEWNVATRLVSCLERLLGMGDNDQTDLLILSALTLLQGILLLHPPSRSIFAREIYMNLLLDLLDIQSCPSIPSTTLLVLVTALLATPANTRTFERTDGLLAMTSLFKSRSTPRDVKLKVVEFLYFYLMPETPAPTSANSSINAGTPATAAGQGLQRSPSKLPGGFGERRSNSLHGAEGGGGGGGVGEERITRTMEEKQKLLGRHLSNVEDLVQDLRDNAPFGEMIC